MPHSEDDDDFGDIDDSALIQAATQAETVNDSKLDFEPSPRPTKRRRTAGQQSIVSAKNGGRKMQMRSGNASRARRRTIISDDEDVSDSTPFATGLDPPRGRYQPEEDSLDEDDAFDPGPSVSIIGPASRSNVTKKTGTGNISGSASPGKKPATKPKHRVHMPDQAIELKDAYYTQLPPQSSCPWMIRGPIWQKKPKARPNQTRVGLSPKSAERPTAQSASPSDEDEDEAFDPPPFPVQEDDAINGIDSTPNLPSNKASTRPYVAHVRQISVQIY